MHVFRNMIRKYHNYKLQTKQCHVKEKPQNNTRHQEDQLNNAISCLPHQDDCPPPSLAKAVVRSKTVVLLLLICTPIMGKLKWTWGAWIAHLVACLALTSWITLPCRFESLASPACNGMYLKGLTVTFRVAVVSQCISQPKERTALVFSNTRQSAS